MVMRVKRTIDIAMSNYTEIIGFSVFTYEGKVVYASDNMNISEDIGIIINAWNGVFQQFSLKGVSFLSALSTNQGFVAINPDGAVSFICGTGKGVWFVFLRQWMWIRRESFVNASKPPKTWKPRYRSLMFE